MNSGMEGIPVVHGREEVKTRNSTARKQPRQWQVRDRLNRAWRWPLYSRARAVAALAAALTVVVIWPQITGGSRSTPASTSSTAPATAAPTAATWSSTPTAAAAVAAATASTGAVGQGTPLTEPPQPPVLTASPDDYTTPETVAAKYLQAWCYQPVNAPVNSNITNAAAFMTDAGLADDQSRAPGQSALTSICGPVTVTRLGEQPSTPDRALVVLSTRQVLLNPAGSIIGQQSIEQTRRILRGPDGRWLVDIPVQAG
jgi:hypothetical protein